MSETDIFLTNKCNSNCIMCPLSKKSRRQEDVVSEAELYSQIDCLPHDIEYINITGGEPTFFVNRFLNVLSRLKDHCQNTDFQLLTNGRSFADETLVERMLEVCPHNIKYTIPLHSSTAEIHDSITRSEGSFEQTDLGIKNLLLRHQKVEIRIVLSKANISSAFDTAKYIIENYRNVYGVTFIAMEMMGNAAVNREKLWIDYNDAFESIRGSINYLVSQGIDVLLYNFPLCAVGKGYWHMASKSITPYKIRYMDECKECSVKDICGGFFYSTKQVMKPTVRPIR